MSGKPTTTFDKPLTKFIVKQEFGNVDKKGALSLISKLEPKHLQYFFPLKEMMEQVMTEIK